MWEDPVGGQAGAEEASSLQDPSGVTHAGLAGPCLPAAGRSLKVARPPGTVVLWKGPLCCVLLKRVLASHLIDRSFNIIVVSFLIIYVHAVSSF